VYRSEFSWQERACWKGRPRPWSAKHGYRVVSYAPGHPFSCGCSAWAGLTDRMSEFYRGPGVRRVFDVQVTPREALSMVRRYLPKIRTTRDLAEAAAWQPFKVVLAPGRPLYTTWGLLLWARSHAAGRLAPWATQ
jgi:hypothetical protein